MAQGNVSQNNGHQVRWFIWAIVFLVVVGVSLVTYIIVTGSGDQVPGDILTHHPATSTKTPVKTPVKK